MREAIIEHKALEYISKEAEKAASPELKQQALKESKMHEIARDLVAKHAGVEH
jgi:hypothetical protein